MLEEEKNGFGMSFYKKTMCIVSFPNPLAPDTCQLGNPTTCALHSVHRSGAPYSMMSVSFFPILQVLARLLHPLIFQSGLMSAHSSHTGHFLTLFQHHQHCENSFRLYSVHPRQSKWANSFGKVAV